jgi:hypothetical protein
MLQEVDVIPLTYSNFIWYNFIRFIDYLTLSSHSIFRIFCSQNIQVICTSTAKNCIAIHCNKDIK